MRVHSILIEVQLALVFEESIQFNFATLMNKAHTWKTKLSWSAFLDRISLVNINHLQYTTVY